MRTRINKYRLSLDGNITTITINQGENFLGSAVTYDDNGIYVHTIEQEWNTERDTYPVGLIAVPTNKWIDTNSLPAIISIDSYIGHVEIAGTTYHVFAQINYYS